MNDISAERALDEMAMFEAVDRCEIEIIRRRKLKWNMRGSEPYVLKLSRADDELAGMVI